MHAYSLMYHDVVPIGAADDSGFPGGDAAIYKLEEPQFRAHMRAITDAVVARGYDRPGAADLARAPHGRTAVLLHFDDGGASALHVADVLEEHGWRGYFHITTDRIGDAGFVTGADVRALHERGHIVGSHSASHPPRISALPRAEIEREWSRSVAVLSELCGAPVTVASVPGGYSSREVIEAADRAGIEILFHSEPESSYDWVRGCLVLGRYAIKRATSATEAADIAVGARAPRWRQWALWNAKKAAKRLGGTHWLSMRKRILNR